MRPNRTTESHEKLAIQAINDDNKIDTLKLSADLMKMDKND